MRKKLGCFVFLFPFFFSTLSAQSGRGTIIGSMPKSEGMVLIALGPAWLSGDIGGAHMESLPGIMNNTHFLFSAGFRQNFNRTNLGYKLMLQYGNFLGSDIGSRLDARGYAYETDLLEASLQGEYYFLKRRFSASWGVGLYAYAGVGVAYSFVDFISAPPVSTRPDDLMKMEGASMFIPFGVGVELKLAPRFKLGVEIGTQYHFYDFLDGLKPSFSKHNDVLSAVSFTASYRLFGGDGKRNEENCNCW